MKGIGPAGDLSMSRTLGTKVTLAGRTAFLPNGDVPFVMQKLTRGLSPCQQSPCQHIYKLS